jgi:hypothetical protein
LSSFVNVARQSHCHTAVCNQMCDLRIARGLLLLLLLCCIRCAPSSERQFVSVSRSIVHIVCECDRKSRPAPQHSRRQPKVDAIATLDAKTKPRRATRVSLRNRRVVLLCVRGANLHAPRFAVHTLAPRPPLHF